jgi:streptogramin lyase
MQGRMKNGFKPLCLPPADQKGLMYRLMVMSYGRHPVKMAAKKLKEKINAKVLGANRLKFTPDGKLVFIASLQTGELTIVDAKTHMEVKRLKIGKGSAGILMDTDGSRAFVACSADNYIAIIDMKSLEVTGHFEVGGVPDGMAWAVQP